MVLLLFLGRTGSFNARCLRQEGFNYQQKCSLVNVKLKWAKDRALDAAVAGQGDLRATCFLVSIIASCKPSCLPIYHLTKHRGQLGLPNDLKLSTFIRRYPTIFHESYILDSGGTRVPCFQLTPEALRLHREELNILEQNQIDLVERLCKLLMLTRDRTLPLQTIDQLKWDIGLPYNYSDSLIQCYPNIFCLIRLPDERVGLRLQFWDDRLAISHLQKNVAFQQKEEDIKSGCLSFPIGFTRGFGLKRKCMKWLEEWQKLPYTSPYANASHLDPRTDVSEKRIVGVFHELLHLAIHKKTERKNVSNLRQPLSLPQKFTKVFDRHPGIFYISKKNDTQTVVLREAYDRQQLLHKHPLVDIREQYANLMREGFLDRSRGLYKKSADASYKEDSSNFILGNESCGSKTRNEEELHSDLVSTMNMASDFMFCDLCGTMLSMNSTHYAECPLCKFKKDSQELTGREISYKVSAEDLRRDLGISHFEGKLEVRDMEINKKCEKCSNTKLRFSTRQMRSADEGQTTFFHCPVCSHTFTEN